jgi:hypothetical protein
VIGRTLTLALTLHTPQHYTLPLPLPLPLAPVKTLSLALPPKQQYRQWAYNPWDGAHTVGPGGLGCPFRDSALRLLPKGACGVSPAKPPHDDDNGVGAPSAQSHPNRRPEPLGMTLT